MTSEGLEKPDKLHSCLSLDVFIWMQYIWRLHMNAIYLTSPCECNLYDLSLWMQYIWRLHVNAIYMTSLYECNIFDVSIWMQYIWAGRNTIQSVKLYKEMSGEKAHLLYTSCYWEKVSVPLWVTLRFHYLNYVNLLKCYIIP